MNRKQALNKIRTAYENKELGFQKGAEMCRYYDAESDSHCAIGVLVGKKKELIEGNGDIYYPFIGAQREAIDEALDVKGRFMWFGLHKKELSQLQRLHDNIINWNIESDEPYHALKVKFKVYLYSL